MTRPRCRLACLPALAFCLAGCARIPSTYAPPMERRPVTGFGNNSLGGVIGMAAPGAPAHIVNGVSPVVESGSWRWVRKRAELRFAVGRVNGVRAVMDFAIADGTFRTTGPVTFAFFVNGRLLDTVRYDHPGNHHWEKPVPPEWLRTDGMTILAAEIDKVYKSPEDGVEMGFILSRAGFQE
jgi:hypothetical protein